MSKTVEVLAVGTHPDDVEICCGGLVAKLATQGYRTAILDLSAGELGTRGSPAERAAEAERAAAELGVAHRENLGLPDGAVGFEASGLSAAAQLERVTQALRRLRPELLLIPYWQERHPDHTGASALLTRAVFLAGLRNYLPPAEPWTPRLVLHYQMRYEFTPSFITDTSACFARKLAAIRCFSSQVDPARGVPTLLSSPLTLEALTARDQHYGAMIGAACGEPYLLRTPLHIADPLEYARHGQVGAALYGPALL